MIHNGCTGVLARQSFHHFRGAIAEPLSISTISIERLLLCATLLFTARSISSALSQANKLIEKSYISGLCSSDLTSRTLVTTFGRKTGSSAPRQ
jgi:hypothetical protein